ncbi:hypothetical protein GW17_00026556 [Ensete ventricosum]|nr:hypothetical protein GW17_00026556 [Ensete ventricosum]
MFISRYALPSGKTLYRLVRSGPAADRYTNRPLPDSTTKIDHRRSIEGEIDHRQLIEGTKGKKKKKRRRRKKERRRRIKKKRIHTSFPRTVLAHGSPAGDSSPA